MSEQLYICPNANKSLCRSLKDGNHGRCGNHDKPHKWDASTCKGTYCIGTSITCVVYENKPKELNIHEVI